MSFRIESDWTTKAGLRAVVGVVCFDGVDSHRCGYVAVEKTHPLYGEPYDQHYDLKVHGGLTYARGGDSYPVVCGEGVWWFGFDAAHFGDGSMNPRMREYRDGMAPVRSLSYMMDECESLAAQIEAYKAPSLSELLRSDRELSSTKRAEIAAILDTIATLSTQIKGA